MDDPKAGVGHGQAPDPEEVRQRQGPCRAPGCGHTKGQHGLDVLGPGRALPGRCEVGGCRCIGWDPMTSDEWAAVMAGSDYR
jgi:hypothetical protein